MGEMREKTTIRTLCEMTGTNPDTMRMRFAKLREKNPTLFPEAWRIDSELSQAQITELLKAGDRKGGAPRQEYSERFTCTDDSEPAKGLPNEAAPAGGFEAKRNYWHIAALAVAFVFPTIASGINTFTISHQLSGQPAGSYALLGMVSLTPILFIIARMERVGVVVALGVVAFEAFCNVAATYLSLMGGMVYAFGVPRGACSPFLQNIVELTESAHKNTAIGIAIAVAIIVSSVQLTAFWGLKNRI